MSTGSRDGSRSRGSTLRVCATFASTSWARAEPAGRTVVQAGEVGSGLFLVVEGLLSATAERRSLPAAATLLRTFAQDLTPDEPGAQRLMIQAWAVVHGLAMLMLDGQIPVSEDIIRTFETSRLEFRFVPDQPSE